VAIVDDIRKDRRTKNVLAQTNTKTVSAPPASTGLIGDQLPAEVFTVEDFDIVKNQVHLEEKNFQLLEALNTIGQVSNMQSQSGPIPGTLKVVTSTGTSAGNNIAFQPAAGEVWELTAASFGAVGSGSWRGILALKDGDGNYVELVDKSTSGTGQSLDFSTPVYITNDVYLEFTIVTVDTSLSVKAAVVRVR
jgi:hypothetical protein